MEPLHIPNLLRRASLSLDDDALSASLEVFDAFLRSERFAVATYDAALPRITDDEIRGALTSLRNSHEARGCILHERIVEFGGSPPPRDGAACGAFFNAFRRVRCAADVVAIMDALFEGEHWAVRDYEIDLDQVADSLRAELALLLLHEQRRTRDALERLITERA